MSTSPAPIRIQLSRRKGFNLQAASLAANGLRCVNVARPSKWGNPFDVKNYGSAEICVNRHKRLIRGNIWSFPNKDAALLLLRGKNLACWCKLGEPCHADTLLEIANRPT